MTRYHWTLDGDIYRLRPEGGKPVDYVVSMVLDRGEWMWCVFNAWSPTARGSVSACGATLATAQRMAVEHARDVGVIGREDEVIE